VTAPLRIEAERDGFRAVVRCVGEIDQSTADDVTHALGEAMATDAEELVLDLTGVRFMDSTGLHAVIVAATSAEGVGMRFTVLPSGPVQRLLEVAGLRDIVQGRVYP
jgi:anti-sigma B factor antagonist